MDKKLLAAFVIAASFSGCTTKSLVEPVVGTGVYASVEQPVCSDANTKSFSSNSNVLSFFWAEGERVAVLGQGELALFNSVSEGTDNAKLESKAYKLKDGIDYIAYIPASLGEEGNSSVIPVSFAGQVQDKNNSTSHLKKYSYACGNGSKVEGEDKISFNLKNQTAWIVIEHSLTDDSEIKAVTLSSEDELFTSEAKLDVANAEWTSEKKVSTIALSLGSEGLSFKCGDVLRAFLTVFPDDLSNKAIQVKAIKKDGSEVLLKSFNGVQLNKNGYYTVRTEGTTTVQVGEQVYSSLQQALDEVQAGGTVTLLSDITSSQGFNYAGGSTTKAVGDAGVTLDLGGHSLKVTSDTKNNHRAVKVTGGTLTIKNGVIDARNVNASGEPEDFNDKSKYTQGMYGTIRAEGGDINLEDVKLYSNHLWGLSIKVLSGSKVSLDNVTVNARVGGGMEVSGGSAVVKNSAFIQQGISSYANYLSTGISVSLLGEVTIENTGFDVDGYHSLYVYNSGGIINVNGGVFSSNGGHVVHVDAATFEKFHAENEGDETEDRKLFDAFVDAHGGYSSIVAIESGEFTGKLYKTLGNEAQYASLAISGGVFSENPEDYVAEGYIVLKDGNVYRVGTKEELNTIIGNNTKKIASSLSEGGTATLVKTLLWIVYPQVKIPNWYYLIQL